jgi:prepilin-type N-terminal cleavage/methylation domain-containing protein
MNSRNKGFTLIELLVVIAVIGILAGVIIASLSSARAKGRDARRLSDLREFRTALLLCYDKLGSYYIEGETQVATPGTREPTNDADFVASWITNCGEFMAKPPVDPQTGFYVIHTTTDYSKAVLLATLENSSLIMTNAQVNAIVAGAGITGWTPATTLNFAISF